MPGLTANAVAFLARKPLQPESVARGHVQNDDALARSRCCAHCLVIVVARE